MYTALIITHVISMFLSLGLMGTAIVLGLFGKTTSARIATVGMFATGLGGGTGAVLLFDAPLSIQCATLTAYLAGVTSLYVFGFARGNADRARLIRRPAIQNR